MITQPAEMMMARRQWHKHFVAQLGSRFEQHPGAEMEDHWEEMVYYRNRYAEFRKSWARERTAAALAEAQAEVARLRATLEAITKNSEWALTWKPVNNYDKGYTRATLDNGNIARAALEIAPAGEA